MSVSVSGGFCFDYWRRMDPELWRCRRTDGKKWRCSKNVVPQQKYCDGHMHRGCQRSRKPVEASPTAASSNTAVSTNSTPVNLKPRTSSSNHVAVIGHNKGKDVAITINSHDIDGRGNHVGRTGENAIMGKHIGLSFSPNSVLQGCSSNVWYCKSKVEAEPGRCRRTDGKKWRCSRDVIPDNKYCERHMHRGAKKPVTVLASVNSNLSIASPPPPLDEKGSSSSSGDTTITDTSTNASENGTAVL